MDGVGRPTLVGESVNPWGRRPSVDRREHVSGWVADKRMDGGSVNLGVDADLGWAKASIQSGEEQADERMSGAVSVNPLGRRPSVDSPFAKWGRGWYYG